MSLWLLHNFSQLFDIYCIATCWKCGSSWNCWYWPCRCWSRIRLRHNLSCRRLAKWVWCPRNFFWEVECSVWCSIEDCGICGLGIAVFPTGVSIFQCFIIVFFFLESHYLVFQNGVVIFYGYSHVLSSSLQLCVNLLVTPIRFGPLLQHR